MRNRRSAECGEKYLESLQLLRQNGGEEKAKTNKNREMEQNKQVCGAEAGSGDVAENLLQLNFTPAKKMRRRGENEYELRS